MPFRSQEIRRAAAKIPFSGPSAALNECLKFNRPFEKHGLRETRVMRDKSQLVGRFFGKLASDVLPAALASLLGGMLFTQVQFQIGRMSAPAATAQVVPASPEMMAMLRDEHGQIASFVKAKVASEKEQLAAEDSAARVAVQAQPAAIVIPTPSPAPQRQATTVQAVKPVSRSKERAPVVAASLPAPAQPAAQAQQPDVQAAAHEDDGLIARTLGFKDRVVAATQRAASAIGSIPSYIGSIGDHIGGDDPMPRPPARLISDL
jgi:hypothetical protein